MALLKFFGSGVPWKMKRPFFSVCRNGSTQVLPLCRNSSTQVLPLYRNVSTRVLPLYQNISTKFGVSIQTGQRNLSDVFLHASSQDTGRSAREPKAEVDLSNPHSYVYIMLKKLHYLHRGVADAQFTEDQVKRRIIFITRTVGCHEVEVLEWPKILLLTPKQIEECIDRLQRVGQIRISVPLIHLALENHECTSKKFAEMIHDFLSNMDGSVSHTEYWRARNVSMEKIMQMFSKFRSLISIRSAKRNSVKIDLLTKNGVTVQMILENPYVLERSVETIESRLVRLKAAKVDNLRSLYWFTMSSSLFDKQILDYHKRQADPLLDIKKVLDNLGLSEDDYSSLKEMLLKSHNQRRRLGILFPKIEYLLSNGIRVNDMLNHPEILNFSMKRITSSLTEMYDLGMENIHVSQLFNYLSKKSISSVRSSKRFIADLLQCDMSQLRPEVISVLAELNQSEHKLAENLKFLLSQGFTRADVQKVPLVIGHDTEILYKYWFDLANNLQTYEQCRDDRIKLLNGLQYCIERDLNFKSMIAVKIQEHEE